MTKDIKKTTTPFKILLLSVLIGAIIVLLIQFMYNLNSNNKLTTIAKESYSNLELICMYKNCLYIKYDNRYFVRANNESKAYWGYYTQDINNVKYSTWYEEILSTTKHIDDTKIIIKYIDWELLLELSITLGFFIIIIVISITAYLTENKFITMSETELRNIKKKTGLESDLRMVIAATAHHEMLTPIAVMRATINKLKSSDGYSANEHKETFNILCSTISRLESVINQMSSIRRLYKKHETPFTTIINTTIASLQVIFTEYNFKYNISNTTILDKLSNYKLDCGTISNILNNLFKNSLEAGSDIINIVPSVSKDKSLLTLIIMDNGTGVPTTDGVISDIFKLGYSSKECQIDTILANKKLTANDCRGNGLYLVKTILNSGGGDIVLIETSSKGTVFKVTIPCREIGRYNES